MSVIPSAPPGSDVGSKILHIFRIAMLFFLLGPLVGGVVVVIPWMLWMDPPFGLESVMPIVMLGFLPFYAIGAVPALFAGLAIGFMDAFRGGASLGVAVTVGAAVGVGWSTMIGDGPGGKQIVALQILIGLSCVVATIICWRISAGGRAREQ